MSRDDVFESSVFSGSDTSDESKRLGFVKDLTFETNSGELINLVLKDATPYVKNISLEKTANNELLIPYSSHKQQDYSYIKSILYTLVVYKEIYLL